jgi:site-specific DNA recombinase
MIAAIYARKSNEEEDDKAEDQKSVSRQVAGARAFIASKGWTAREPAYEDDAVSGALFESRPGFKRLMGDAEAGAFDAVVFFDIDRFGRNGRHTYNALQQLADLGISIWDSAPGKPSTSTRSRARR